MGCGRDFRKRVGKAAVCKEHPPLSAAGLPEFKCTSCPIHLDSLRVKWTQTIRSHCWDHRIQACLRERAEFLNQLPTCGEIVRWKTIVPRNVSKPSLVLYCSQMGWHRVVERTLSADTDLTFFSELMSGAVVESSSSHLNVHCS